MTAYIHLLPRLRLADAREVSVAIRVRERTGEQDLEPADARAELCEDRSTRLHRRLGLASRHPAPADDAILAEHIGLPDLELKSFTAF